VPVGLRDQYERQKTFLKVCRLTGATKGAQSSELVEPNVPSEGCRDTDRVTPRHPSVGSALHFTSEFLPEFLPALLLHLALRYACMPRRPCIWLHLAARHTTLLDFHNILRWAHLVPTTPMIGCAVMCPSQSANIISLHFTALHFTGRVTCLADMCMVSWA
jgi:hypothetical protein